MNTLRALWCYLTHTSSLVETEISGPDERGVVTSRLVKCECNVCGRSLKRVPS